MEVRDMEEFEMGLTPQQMSDVGGPSRNRVVRGPGGPGGPGRVAAGKPCGP